MLSRATLRAWAAMEGPHRETRGRARGGPRPQPANSRGADGRPVQQAGVVVALDEVALLAQQAAGVGLVAAGDLHRVRGVVEVDHMDVEDQDSRAGDLGA